MHPDPILWHDPLRETGYTFSHKQLGTLPGRLARARSRYYAKVGRPPFALVLGQREHAEWKCYLMMMQRALVADQTMAHRSSFNGMELLWSPEESKLEAVGLLP